ncbi:MAG TPA: hypothetical protein VGP33_16455 [Chloroflexota bacterium]|nr:hypothetical protein [Chloroflexota bacterium]
MSGIGLRGIWRVLYREVDGGRRWRGGTYANVVCLNGKSFLAAWLNLENPVHSRSNVYGAVGTSAAAPGGGDSALGSELARVALATSSRLGNVVTLDFFFNSGQGNGTLTEAGLFLGAGSGGGSGNLLSHVAISENKTSAVTMTLEFSLQVG